MGAEFATLTVNSTDRKKIAKAFKGAQADDLHMNGHSYSGGLGMAPGLEFDDSKTYDSEEDAEAFLIEKCVKWENAIAVPFKTDDGISYLIGALCSS